MEIVLKSQYKIFTWGIIFTFGRKVQEDTFWSCYQSILANSNELPFVLTASLDSNGNTLTLFTIGNTLVLSCRLLRKATKGVLPFVATSELKVRTTY